jgi:GT2 family glycosyltransferase
MAQLNMPLVSVVILNLNGETYLEKCLSSVLMTKYPNFEVILVDNASTDRSLSLVESSFGNDKRLRIIKNGENVGYSEGNNIGFKHSIGTYVAFLNNDTEVDPYWLTYLVDALNCDKSIGLAQSLLLEINRNEIQTAGFLFSDCLVHLHDLMHTQSSTTILPRYFEVSCAAGAAMISRKELIKEMGLFESRAPFYYDDTLLSLKTWLAGKRVVTVSDSKVFHIGGAAIGANARFTAFHGYRAHVCLVFDVYYKLTDLIQALFVFASSTFYNSVGNASSGNFAVVLARIRASQWVLRNFGYIWQNRLRHWGNAKISSETLLAKFIRLKLPNGVCMLPGSLRKKYLEQVAQKYERMLVCSLQKSLH